MTYYIAVIENICVRLCILKYATIIDTKYVQTVFETQLVKKN